MQPTQPATRKRIPFDAMVSRSYWTWRGNPALTVPTMFSTGLTAMAEAIVGVFGLALLVNLEGTGWLAAIAHDYRVGDYTALANVVLSRSFICAVLLYLVPAFVIAFLVLVIAGGFVYSAEYGSYWQAQGGSHVGVPEVMTKFVERWKPMAWTVFLSNTVTFLPISASLGAIILVAGVAPNSALALVVALLVLLGGSGLTITFALFFVYTPVVVAAEGLSGLAAMRRSWHQVSQGVQVAFAYSLVYIVLTAAISYVSAAIPLVNTTLTSLASVGILVLVTPVLHLTKTEIYAERLKQEPVEFVVYNSFFGDLRGEFPRSLWRTFVKGLGELKRFVLDVGNLGYHFLSAAGLVAGLFLGVWIGKNGLTKVIYEFGYVPGKINPTVTGAPPLTTGFYIFFHNWEASLATALSGVWFPAVPLVTLLLNGVLVGVVSDLVPNATMLAAALLPHGIIELPSFVLAGSAGIKLGVSFFRSFRSPTPEKTARFHEVARQTVYLLIGLALLFFIAGLIEGNVTPVIMRLAGWT